MYMRTPCRLVPVRIRRKEGRYEYGASYAECLYTRAVRDFLELWRSFAVTGLDKFQARLVVYRSERDLNIGVILVFTRSPCSWQTVRATSLVLEVKLHSPSSPSSPAFILPPPEGARSSHHFGTCNSDDVLTRSVLCVSKHAAYC